MDNELLIHEIAHVEMPNVFNPWGESDPLDIFGPGERRKRLLWHFSVEPRFLLIGEAPGYQGCHFAGVPFTNEKLLINGLIPRVECNTRITTRDKPWSEPSATVVWGTLRDLGIAADVVMWNAFAWHPHKPGEPYTNRTPTRDELIRGSEILRKVVANFPQASVVAIGNKARDLLSWLDVKTIGSVRHPSMGGATQFRDGMSKLVVNHPLFNG